MDRMSDSMQVGVHVGGTFTDFVGFRGTRLITAKLPTTRYPSRAVVAGLRQLHAEGMAHGTTVATNAVLERRGATTAFVTTAGFEDLLAMPLRVEEYRLIPGSGGPGRFVGGDGLRRSLRFLGAKGTASILSERRTLRPQGLAGGEPGHAGRNLLVRSRRTRVLPAKVTLPIRRGDVIVIETPGGGGWGAPSKRAGSP